MATFDLEQKIRYDNLAPSLQAMFVFTAFSIFLSRVINTGEDGQVLKIDANNKTIYADDNFHILKTATNDAELALMKSKPLTNLNILTYWKSYTCGASQVLSSTSNISYNASNRTITLNLNNGATSASISNTPCNRIHSLFVKFAYQSKISQGEFGIIISAAQISNNWYDLSCVYSNGTMSIVLCNYFSTGQKKVLASGITKSYTWGSSADYCYIKANQEYGKIIMSASATNEKIRNYTISYELPYIQINSGLSRNQFSVLTTILRDKTATLYVGFGATNIVNYIYPITGLTDDNDIIYNLKQDEMYLPEGNNWMTNYLDDSLPDRSFIFNKYTSSLYWFKNMGNYYLLASSPATFTIGYPSTDEKIIDGQVGKYDTSSSLMVDANFRNLRVASNAKELAYMKTNSRIISLNDVFSNWDRLAIETGNILYKGNVVAGSIIDDMSSAYSKWSFNSSTNTIANNGNWNSFGAFLSSITYYNYYLIISCIGDADDDMIGLIVAAMEDSNGVPHTIGLYAAGDAESYEQSHMPAGCRQYALCLVYDYDVPSTQLVLSYLNFNDNNSPAGDIDTINTATGIGVKGTNVIPYTHDKSQLLYVRRNAKHIEGKCSENGSTTYNMFLSYTLPDTYAEALILHPSMTATQWNNINTMLSGYSKVGFCTKSNDCQFGIVDQQEIFEQNDIYSIYEDKIYSYNSSSSSWVDSGKKCSNEIPPKSFLYNSLIKQLWYYDGGTSFTTIHAK